MPMPPLRRIFGPPPFSRLSAVNALGSAADSFFAISLAGSLFFNVSIGAARPRVIAYLVLTLAPFVVLAPLVSPMIDRFGRARPAVLASTCLVRGILCLFVAGDLRNLLLYPEAFGILVLEKAFSVTKSALVPSLVHNDAELVHANSRLARAATIAGLPAGAIAATVLALSNASAVLRIASLVYFAAAVFAMRIAPGDPRELPPRSLERSELHAPKVRLAAGAMSVLRGSIGFLVFLVVFGLKRAGEPTWFFGIIAAVSIGGGLVGAFMSPLARRRLGYDERLLGVALFVATAATLGAALWAGHVTVAIAVFVIAFATSIARQGFDAILQRDASDAARGRSFARFETLFQLFWVIGALAAVIFEPSTRIGLAVLAFVFVTTLAVFMVGTNQPRPVATA
ncbi:MAG: Major Facilitator Superfamily transporter [Actinomycetia bacterium]|nr:Major Facilitator Superfamily transporter [Actinomycetes bacterium]